MAAKRTPLIAGNWKMNGLAKDAEALVGELSRRLAAAGKAPFDMLVCPPGTLIARVAQIADNGLLVGGQDCHAEKSGAFTGDVSAEMLRDAGASHVIVGHSERRHGHGETDAIVNAKALAAWRAGLVAVLCIGETLAERDASRTLDVLERQILDSVPQEGATAENLVIAYEPVWAIGTGRTPSVADVAAAHSHIRKVLGRRLSAAASVRLLYGGSVKADNAASLMAVEDVDGALVGGASLKAADFWAIAQSVP